MPKRATTTRGKRNRKDLSEANVLTLPCKRKQYMVWDKGVKGLHVLVSPAALGRIAVSGTTQAHRSHTVAASGRVGVVSLDQARQLCRRRSEGGEGGRRSPSATNRPLRQLRGGGERVHRPRADRPQAERDRRGGAPHLAERLRRLAASSDRLDPHRRDRRLARSASETEMVSSGPSLSRRQAVGSSRLAVPVGGKEAQAGGITNGWH